MTLFQIIYYILVAIMSVFIIKYAIKATKIKRDQRIKKRPRRDITFKRQP